MKKMSLLLLLSLLLFSPLHVSAMMEGEEKNDTRTLEEKVLDISKKQTEEELIKERERGNPTLTATGFLEETISIDISESSESKDLQQLKKIKEDLTDPNTLKQRLQEAKEVVAKLQSKGPALSEAELRQLFQQWSERQKCSQEALEKLETANNNTGLIAQQLNKLITASQGILQELGAALENLVLHNATRAFQTTGSISKPKWQEELIDSSILENAHQALQEHANRAREGFEKLQQFRDNGGDISNPLAPNHPRREVLALLKTYEDKRYEWLAKAKEKGLSDAKTLKQAAKAITHQIIEKLDFKTPKDGAVFWTGYEKRNQEVAKYFAEDACQRAAEQSGNSEGKKTIEMTHDGTLLNQLGMYESDSPILNINADGKKINGKSKLGDILFDAASIKFAKEAQGKVTAIIYSPGTADEKTKFEKSAYARIEKPILLDKQKEGSITLTEHPVSTEITHALLNKIDRLTKEAAKKAEGLKDVGEVLSFGERLTKIAVAGKELPMEEQKIIKDIRHANNLERNQEPQKEASSQLEGIPPLTTAASQENNPSFVNETPAAAGFFNSVISHLSRNGSRYLLFILQHFINFSPEGLYVRDAGGQPYDPSFFTNFLQPQAWREGHIFSLILSEGAHFTANLAIAAAQMGENMGGNFAANWINSFTHLLRSYASYEN